MSVTNGMFKINDLVLPYPDKGLKMPRQQLVDSARNAQGEVVAQKINRRLIKLEGLSWKYLPTATWSAILNEIEKFEGLLTFYDARTRSFITRRVYWGDATDEPWEINPATGEVLAYMNCQCNIIDMGYADV